MNRKYGFVGGLFLVVALGGCDTLKARLAAQQAVDLYHRGEIAEAAAQFAAAEQLDPTVPAIELDLGFVNLALYQASPKGVAGQQAASRAVAAFERYLALKPDEERAKSYLVQTFVDTGRYEDAVAFFRPAVEKSPPDGDAMGTLGTIAAKTGRFEDARSWYGKRIAAQAGNAEARLALGVLIWDHLHSHAEIVGLPRIQLADEAIAILAEAITRQPKAPVAYTYTNLVYRERSLAAANDDEKRVDLEQANKFFQRANELASGGGAGGKRAAR